MKTTQVFDANWRAYRSKKRTIINRGGTRSSKTYSACQLLYFIAKHSKKSLIITIVSRTLPHLKGGAIRDMEAVLLDDGVLVDSVHHSSDKYFKIGNSRIEYFGADDEARVHGPSRDILFVNEANYIDFKIYNHLAIRTTGTIFIDYNPSHKFWVDEMNIDTAADSVVITSTFKDNIENLSEAQIKEILANKTKADNGDAYWINWWLVYGEGRYSDIKLGSEFIHQFHVHKHVKDVLFNPELPIHLSFDQNVVPYVSCLLHQIEKIEDVYVVSVFDEITLENPYNNTTSICMEIQKRYDKPFYIYGDATGKKRDTRNKENDYDIINRILRKNINNQSMRVPAGNPPVKKTRDFLNKIYADGFKVKIQISDKCKKFIDDLQNVKEDFDGGMLKEKFKNKETGQTYEKWGHLLDCHRYFLCEAFKGFFNR